MSDKGNLFDLLPAGGDWISREAARAALSERLERELSGEEFDGLIWQLSEKVAWDPHNRLVRRRLLNDIQELPQTIRNERDIEGWFERYVWNNAARVFFDPAPPSYNLVVQNTARIPGQPGRWTRPDLCMACIARYQYAPVPALDLFSFELKMPSGCNMLAVHEALSHTVTAHFAYLGLFLPLDAAEARNLPGMLEQAQRHGVGVIQITDPQRDTEYRLLAAGRRHSPAPSKIDAFIDSRFDEANRLALRRWVRR